jgi:hypothetical protein
MHTMAYATQVLIKDILYNCLNYPVDQSKGNQPHSTSIDITPLLAIAELTKAAFNTLVETSHYILFIRIAST